MSEQTQNPWQDVTWFIACQHCGATTTKSNLTFMGGLHCTRCDEVTELPQEVAYRTNIERAVKADRDRHRAEIARLTEALSEARRPSRRGPRSTRARFERIEAHSAMLAQMLEQAISYVRSLDTEGDYDAERSAFIARALATLESR